MRFLRGLGWWLIWSAGSIALALVVLLLLDWRGAFEPDAAGAVERFKWFFGLVVVGLAGGQVLVSLIREVVVFFLDLPHEDSTSVPVWLSGAVTGVLERAFFVLCVATGVGGTAIAMITWTVLKNAALWDRFLEGPERGASKDLTKIYMAIIMSLGSMLAALLGGLVIAVDAWGGWVTTEVYPWATQIFLSRG